MAAGLVLPPLFWLAWACGAAIVESGPAALDPISWNLLARSLWIAGMAVGLAGLMGLAYGWCVLRYPVPGRRVLLFLGVVPLLFPPYATAHAWILLLLREGPINRTLIAWGWIERSFSAEGCPYMTALILAFTYWPVVGGLVLLAARSVPRELEESARLHLPDAAAARWAAGPALRSTLPAALLLVFLLALADFGVANTLAVPTYPVEIVNRYQLDRDPGAVARFALPLLLVVIPLVWLQRAWFENTPLGEDRGGQPALLRSRVAAGWSLVGALIVLLFSVFLPLGTLAAHSLPVETYAAVWAESRDHFGNTLLSSGAAALVTTGAALLFGRRRKSGGLLDLAVTLPYAIPASLIGIAMVQLLNRPGLAGDLYESPVGVVWTYGVLFFPFAHRTVQLGWRQVDPALLDEGRILGAGVWSRFRHAVWPVVRPWAVTGALLVAVLAAREIDATTLVRHPEFDTVAFRIYDYLHFAPGPHVAALSVLLVALSFYAVAAAALWTSARN